MKKKHQILFFVILFSFLTSCNGQTKTNFKNPKDTTRNIKKVVGGGCDGCELMYVGIPNTIKSVDTSAGWNERGQKLLITGTVYSLDGKTPAPNVILYYWQTDNNGYYSPKIGMDEKAKRHGHIRGWIKSDQNGKYALYTIRSASYPNSDLPAHIHISIKEPHIETEYYIDEFVFNDDPYLIKAHKKNPPENRGGSGILRILLSDDIQIAEKDIVLGLNIPNYPKTINSKNNSGLQIGEDTPSFIPYHAFGPDKGSRACPVCKYGRYHGIVYFVGNKPNWNNIKKWLLFLDQESLSRSKYLKAYFVYGNENNYSKGSREKELERVGNELHLKNIALTFVASMTDIESEVNLNKINPSAENTFIIYRHRTIIEKFIDLKPTTDNFKTIQNTLNKTKGDYFHLSEPKHE